MTRMIDFPFSVLRQEARSLQIERQCEVSALSLNILVLYPHSLRLAFLRRALFLGFSGSDTGSDSDLSDFSDRGFSVAPWTLTHKLTTLLCRAWAFLRLRGPPEQGCRDC